MPHRPERTHTRGPWSPLLLMLIPIAIAVVMGVLCTTNVPGLGRSLPAGAVFLPSFTT
jgi:hypothetical protein